MAFYFFFVRVGPVNLARMIRVMIMVVAVIMFYLIYQNKEGSKTNTCEMGKPRGICRRMEINQGGVVA